MAHEEFVPAGSFSATWDASGHLVVTGMIGGGEALPMPPDPQTTLSVTLQMQFYSVADTVLDTYQALGLLPLQLTDPPT